VPDLLLGPLLRHVDETSATVWVETDAPCRVQVLDCSTPTFTVAGHHYALVVCNALEPGTVTTYDVILDGERVWPRDGDPYPAPTIRTRTRDGSEPFRLLFGSCRVTRPHEPPYTLSGGEDGVGVDALHAYGRRMLELEEPAWPDAMLLVGDQVYADEVSPQTLEHIERTRGTDAAPGEGVADFEEYTLLYREAWSDPLIRWVLSTLPTAMVFDDHDVHDDWNTSAQWRRQMQATDWWAARIEGGLMAYWLYQHLGNLGPTALADDPTWAALKEVDDGDELLRDVARRADAEADGGKGAAVELPPRLRRRAACWSWTRGAGGCSTAATAPMVDAREWTGSSSRARTAPPPAAGQLAAGALPPAFHGLEAWNEAVCDGAWGPRWRAVGRGRSAGPPTSSTGRRSARLRAAMDLVSDVGLRPDRTGAGEHHVPRRRRALLLPGEARFGRSRQVTSAVHQAVCSPVRNPVNRPVQVGDRSRAPRRRGGIGRLLMCGRVPKPSSGGGRPRPRFDNRCARWS
jgi:hypothetical protein